jgi:twinkle protein
MDVPALDRILEMHTQDKWKDNIPAIASLPHGAASASKDLARLASKIKRSFKEVSFCFDNDKAGQEALEAAMKVFPDATSIELPCKDANECILQGKTKAAHKAVTFNAVKAKNTRLVWGREVHESAKVPAQWGVPWPWKRLTDLTRGIRPGETYYLGAAQKMGKSEVVNTLGAWLIEKVGWSVMMAKPEEANAKTYKLVAGKIAGKVFHDPKVEFDEGAYDAAGEVIQDKLCMVNLYQHLGWDTLKTDIRSAASEGCKAVFIDPITNLTNGMDSADANTKLQEIAQELAAMAKDLDVAIFIFCHLRNPDSGLSHDRGGHVLTSQFAGSRAMGRSCNYMFGLEGNKDPDLSDEERNVRHLVLLDDREFGEVGSIPLFWNRKTGLFAEM